MPTIVALDVLPPSLRVIGYRPYRLLSAAPGLVTSQPWLSHSTCPAGSVALIAPVVPFASTTPTKALPGICWPYHPLVAALSNTTFDWRPMLLLSVSTVKTMDPSGPASSFTVMVPVSGDGRFER